MALFELRERPAVANAPLVMYFEGFIDSGQAASTAMQTIVGPNRDDALATFDCEALLDYRARRPIQHLVEGVSTGLTWPKIELYLRKDQHGRDVLALTGPEPDHLWPSFAQAVCDLALEFDVQLVVNLGAYPAAAPHSRDPRLSATSPSPALAQQPGYVNATLDIPSGIHAPIEHLCTGHGIGALGLWAQVPHYASSMPYPASAVALLDGLRQMVGLEFDTTELRQQSASMGIHLDELIARNDEHVQMLRQLEIQYDMLAQTQSVELPSGDEIAAELEKFLRDQQQ